MGRLYVGRMTQHIGVFAFGHLEFWSTIVYYLWGQHDCWTTAVLPSQKPNRIMSTSAPSFCQSFFLVRSYVTTG